MAHATDKIVAELEREWPHWQVWCVHRYIGGTTWHARRWGETDGRKTLNAGSPDELAEAITGDIEDRGRFGSPPADPGGPEGRGPR